MTRNLNHVIYRPQTFYNTLKNPLFLQIKVIDPSKKTCETLLGTGKPGLSSDKGNVQFDEPGGLCVSPNGQSLYVADTNNHAIRVIDLNTKTISQVRALKSFLPQLQVELIYLSHYII